MTVSCSTCHRREERQAGEVRVVVPGGARRSEDPAADAFEVWSAAQRGDTGPIVGACPGCGQPLVADRALGAVAVDWEVQTAQGPLWLGGDGAITGPDGVWDSARATELLGRRRVAPRTRIGVGLFQGALFLFLLGPLAVWVFSVVFVTFFLSKFPEIHGP